MCDGGQKKAAVVKICVDVSMWHCGSDSGGGHALMRLCGCGGGGT